MRRTLLAFLVKGRQRHAPARRDHGRSDPPRPTLHQGELHRLGPSFAGAGPQPPAMMDHMPMEFPRSRRRWCRRDRAGRKSGPFRGTSPRSSRETYSKPPAWCGSPGSSRRSRSWRREAPVCDQCSPTKRRLCSWPCPGGSRRRSHPAVAVRVVVGVVHRGLGCGDGVLDHLARPDVVAHAPAVGAVVGSGVRKANQP